MSPPSFTGLGTVGIGLSSAVLRLDAVAKCYFGRNIEDREREIAVLKRLGADGYKRNKNIVRWYGVLDGCILLQRAHHGSIRQYYLQYDPHRPPLSTQLQWAEQATDAICFLHSKGVVHCDISCNNIFIDDNLDAIVGDFAGSSIDGNQKCPLYETSHCHPDQKVSSEISDIFALGSTFYEMLVGRKPYDGMEHREIEEAIRNGNFPSLESLPALKTIILDCWNGRYKAATELLEDVRKEGIYSPIAKLAF
ncbi:kinase-like protein [Nemania abortiva]|nr:kinase-like protein [Nemania abortiva]